MKIELSDAKIQRMAAAIAALRSIDGFTGAASQTLVLQYGDKDGAQTTGLSNYVHKSTWPTIEPIMLAFCMNVKALRDQALLQVRNELRRIADGGEES